ncbi:MAG: hypothetical protein EXQ70_07925 [Solirubrobacterales bacterium]|nr:hypothetical protein [Solirubrobacterales bacterium]
MRRGLFSSVVVLSVAGLAAICAPASAAPDAPRLAAVNDWSFAISTDVDSDAAVQRLAPYDLVVVDGELTKKGRVRQLQDQGALVLAYLSVGTIESFRSWYAKAKPYRMELWGDWGEWYANVRKPGYRKLILDRVAPETVAKGFDGLFLDNVDMIDGHSKQRGAMFKLVRKLAALVHKRNGFLFAQNGAKTIKPVWGALDGWNREDVSWTYDFDRKRYVRQRPADTAEAQAALERLSDAGLLVTATDYTRAGDAAAEDEAIANACEAGALPYVSNISLTRIPLNPLTCP